MELVFLGRPGNKVLAELPALPNIGDVVALGPVHWTSHPTERAPLKEGQQVRITGKLGTDSTRMSSIVGSMLKFWDQSEIKSQEPPHAGGLTEKSNFVSLSARGFLFSNFSMII